MAIYTVALSKGGSTKTTTAAEIAAELARRGRRVLAIDLDQQGNFSTRLGADDDTEVVAVASEVMTGDATVREAAVPSPSVPGVDLLVGTYDLAGLDQRPEVVTALRDQLPQVAGEWDDVVIDTPPALGLVTLAALAAADVVVAAVACETEAYDQLRRLVSFVDERVARMLNPGQQVHWIVPTRYDSRRLLDRDVVDMLNKDHPGRVSSPIREAVAARDAYTSGQPVSVYAPGSGIAQDYAAALAPILDVHRVTIKTTSTN